MQSFKQYFESRSVYCGVLLDEESHRKLLEEFGHLIPDDWVIKAHHMTIAFGKPCEAEEEGKEVELKVVAFGMDNRVAMVKVSGYRSENETPHITLAVNENGGGKAKHSNEIKGLVPVHKNIILKGTVTNL
jgi:hypothetical protein